MNKEALAKQEQGEPVAKLQVTLEDRPIDIELAQYKQMFRAACSALGEVGEALGCDPNEGGSEPLLAAIAELKTSKQEKGEPVAYINIEKRSLEWAHDYMSWDTPTVVNLPRIPLYTTPPQRTWVGLTNEKRLKLYRKFEDCLESDGWEYEKAIEAELKDKNNA
jgi:hypothetical protein